MDGIHSGILTSDLNSLAPTKASSGTFSARRRRLDTFGGILGPRSITSNQPDVKTSTESQERMVISRTREVAVQHGPAHDSHAAESTNATDIELV